MAEQQLEAKLTAPGSTLYYALRRLPPAHRLPCTGLFALHSELHGLVFNRSEAVYIKYGWWHEECARLISGQPRHPITQAIATCRDHSKLNVPDWLTGVEDLLGTTALSDEAELYAFCSALTGPLFAAYSHLMQDLTPRDPNFDSETINMVSAAYTLFGFMQGLGQYLRDGIVPIPRSELPADLPTAGDILGQGLTPSFKNLMAIQYNRLLKLLTVLLERAPTNPLNRQPAILTVAAIQLATLKEMRRFDFDLIDKRIDITPLRKTWIAWNTYRRALQDD